MNNQILGWALSGLAIFPLLLSGTMQVIRFHLVLKNLTIYGWNHNVLLPFGLTQYTIAILYLLPQTAFIGAILATGWMGGAIATHMRVGEKPILQIIIPIFIWIGLAVRNPDVLHLIAGM